MDQPIKVKLKKKKFKNTVRPKHPIRPEYQWLHEQGMEPFSTTKIPGGLDTASEYPEITLAWIRKNCRFAKV